MQYKAWSIPLPYRVPAAAATPYTIEADAPYTLKHPERKQQQGRQGIWSSLALVMCITFAG